VLGDGRFLVALVGISLCLSGGFAILQSASGQLLPHDARAIGKDAMALMHEANGHLLGFMFHDRVAYGGSLVSIGAGYLWLAGFPMAAWAAWAWWALLFSGSIGFFAFLTYLGQGYLDTWHGMATLFLIPVFVAGVWRSRPGAFSLREVWFAQPKGEPAHARGGRILLGACAAGLMLAGVTIAIFGMTTVFVPSDLRFIGLDPAALQGLSPFLIPVISYDRAGFGGGLCSIGSLLLFMARCAELNRSLVEVVALMGLAGFGCAIGVHFAVGYLDVMHLMPAFLGFGIFVLADCLLWIGWRKSLAAQGAPASHSHDAATR
ncbi:MAG: hypothetical protein WBW33_23340, partial [Bryobacteraceae bacterium]